MGDQFVSAVITVVARGGRPVIASVGRWGTSGSAVLTVVVSSWRPVVTSVGRWGTSVVLLCLQ